ncbi:hypothetical protein ACWGQ5_14985 [Streptomyces sp. NPDC055722]
MPENVTNDGHAGVFAHQERVVPVTAEKARRRGGTIDRSSLKGAQVRQTRDQQLLELLRVIPELAEQASVVDGQAGCARKSNDHGFVLGVEGASVETISVYKLP